MYLSLRSIPIWQISNIPNLQLDKSMPDTLKRQYPIMQGIIDCTELFTSLKVPFFKLEASCYIERLDRNRTI